LVFDGQWEACISACDVAARLSPHDPVMWTLQSVKALALIGLERYQEAVVLQNEATQHPTAAWTAYMVLASALSLVDEVSQAAEVMATIRRMMPDFSREDVRRSIPFRRPADLDLLIGSLIKAGLAE
jgi:hypothetical protein